MDKPTPKKRTAVKKQKSIYEAIANFQYDCPILYKKSEGYGYKYTDLAEIMRVITPLLKKHDLFVMQPLAGTGLKTIVCHWPTKETLEEFTEIPQDIALAKMNPFQAQGAGISYWRRYALSSFFGLVSDKDIDMAGKAEPQKPSLTNEKFEHALDAISNGKYTVEELKANFKLSTNQLKKLS